jgi:hypothetical protein
MTLNGERRVVRSLYDSNEIGSSLSNTYSLHAVRDSNEMIFLMLCVTVIK